MSGHSKWASIKRQKSVTDQKRGAAFTKLAKSITIAAKQGGGDPKINFSLRMAIDKAKSGNMPKENIERAIKRGTGELTDEAQIEEIIYEGYGPGGVAILIETATDNRNRTGSDIKHILTKHGGNLGSAGSVKWMFLRRGVIVYENIANPDDITLAAIDAGVDDIEKENDTLLIYTQPENFMKIKETLAQNGFTPTNAEIEQVAKNTIELTEQSDQENLKKIIEELIEHDDVTNFYTNAA